eukprot:scaffold254686_cov17-Tisochrysis_lutea.AAC.1
MPAALRLWRMLGVHTMQILDIMRDSRLLRPPAAQAGSPAGVVGPPGVCGTLLLAPTGVLYALLPAPMLD